MIFLDLLFPPLCFHCNEKTQLRSQLCNLCWELSQVIDPQGRCAHCFEPAETFLCHLCSERPYLPYPRAAVFDCQAPILSLIDEESVDAIAGFAFCQWERLSKADPDIIVSTLPSPIANAFSLLCDKPLVKLLRRRFHVSQPETWEIREGLIEEERGILLFDPGCGVEGLKKACGALAEAFPKRVDILSLSS